MTLRCVRILHRYGELDDIDARSVLRSRSPAHRILRRIDLLPFPGPIAAHGRDAADQKPWCSEVVAFLYADEQVRSCFTGALGRDVLRRGK
jgi:hypothetical protein